MAKNDLTITKNEGGLGRRNPSNDMIFGFIGGGAAVSGKLVLNEIYTVKSMEDVEALGIDAAYDTTNTVLIYHHLSRAFLRNPSLELRLMIVAQTNTLDDICNVSNDFLKKMLQDTNNELRAIGIVHSIEAGYTPTLANGLDEDVTNAIAKAQATYDASFALHKFAEIILEGRQFNGTASAAQSLRALATAAPNVQVVIAQDYEVAQGNALYNKYAAVGDALGMRSLAAVSQNFGELIPEFNLLDSASGAFEVAALSSGQKIAEMSDTDKNTLTEKGYVFAEQVTGLSGFYFNDTSTCAPLSSDYAYSEANDTIQKMIRLVRTALLPYVKGRVPIDPDTGKIDPVYAANLEDEANASLDVMLADGDLSGGVESYIDPDVNLLAGDSLDMEITAVPIAIGRQIKVKLGFNNPTK